MKRARPLALSVLAAATIGSAGSATAQALGPPPGYRLVWADEFDVDGLPDPRKWAYGTEMNKAGWHNHELQYYAGPRAENAVVKGGRLVITARKEDLSALPDWGGQHYSSTRLLTRGRAEWTYGFVEVRAKMPCGRGTWPAIWMLGSGGRWPEDGELDILEQLGHDPTRVFSTVHTAPGHGAHGVGGAQRIADACSAFHDYQLLWTKDELAFGVDGFMHLRYPRVAVGPRGWPFDAPQYLLLNIAIGGDLGGPVDDAIFPVALEVEYVRVYQKP